jgi:molybdopterin-guanine dinucleotide biosynthesis protein A
VYGLVLAGGRSSRMGRDKGLLNFHHLPQHAFLFGELSIVCQRVFTSCRSDQQISEELNPIHDSVTSAGPLAGLLSAFEYSSDCAWLSVAVDMPNVNATVLNELIQQRDSSKLATCFFNEETQSPEPLLTLWEPTGLCTFNKWVDAGNRSPRQFLAVHDIRCVRISNPEVLINVNCPADVMRWHQTQSVVQVSV